MQAQEQVRRLHDQCQELTRELQGARRRTSATASARSAVLPVALSAPIQPLSAGSIKTRNASTKPEGSTTLALWETPFAANAGPWG